MTIRRTTEEGAVWSYGARQVRILPWPREAFHWRVSIARPVSPLWWGADRQGAREWYEVLGRSSRGAIGGRATQQMRNLLFRVGESLGRLRFLSRDRDTKFTAAFDAVYAAEKIEVPPHASGAPRANAHAERWVASFAVRCWTSR